jgi:hypothetical protein
LDYYIGAFLEMYHKLGCGTVVNALKSAPIIGLFSTSPEQSPRFPISGESKEDSQIERKIKIFSLNKTFFVPTGNAPLSFLFWIFMV